MLNNGDRKENKIKYSFIYELSPCIARIQNTNVCVCVCYIYGDSRDDVAA